MTTTRENPHTGRHQSVDLTLADRFSIATPGDWFVLPLDPRSRDRRIAQLVEERMGTQDELAHLRRQVMLKLRKAATDAAANGGFFSAMHSRAVDDRLLSASVLASLPPLLKGPDGTELSDATAVENALVADSDETLTEHSVVDLTIGTAARFRRLSGSGAHGIDGREVMSMNVQFYVPIPDVGKTLTMVFSTSILPLADVYAGLFDAMATTARWVRHPDEGADE